MANNKLKQENPKAQELDSIEKALDKRRVKFLGHILRANSEDPLRKITFYHNSARPLEPTKRRVGGPKKHWTWETLSLAWQHIHQTPAPPFLKTHTQLDKILEEAKNRKF